MSRKLYIGGLAWGTNNEGLKEAFEAFGEVEDARVITDRDTGRSRGFGFVTYAQDGVADKAITELDGKELEGRTIKVSVAQERTNNGGGFRGGNGGGNTGGNRW